MTYLMNEWMKVWHYAHKNWFEDSTYSILIRKTHRGKWNTLNEWVHGLFLAYYNRKNTLNYTHEIKQMNEWLNEWGNEYMQFLH